MLCRYPQYYYCSYKTHKDSQQTMTEGMSQLESETTNREHTIYQLLRNDPGVLVTVL